MSNTNNLRSGFDVFLHDMGRIPLLTAAEEISLGNLVQKGQAEGATSAQKRAAKRAKERMINANLRLVVNVARRFTRRLRSSTMEFSDLVSEGTLGLSRAVDKFDPSLGYKFSTYAYWWIQQGITRALTKHSGGLYVPPNQITLIGKLQKLPVGLTSQQICETLDISEEKLQTTIKAMRAQSVSSLDAQAIGSDGPSSTLVELISDENSTNHVEDLDWSLVTERMEEAAALDINGDVELLLRNVLNQESLATIGKEKGVGRESVRKASNRAKLRLASRMRDLHPLVA